jgi:TPR repeat protein
MNRKRLLAAVAVVCLGVAWPGVGQTEKAERDALAQLQAKADKGDAEAQLKLGTMYATGKGVDLDYKKAVKWHHKAADQGLPAAQHQLGLAYTEGNGVKPDAVEALKWFRRAAEQGFVDAEIDLGRAYANGRGVIPSAVGAVRWFRKAAEQGSAAGQYELAVSYLEGAGVTKDIDEGLKWLLPAAAQGYPMAEYRLAQCYEKGEGVPKDLVQAYKLYDLAAAQDEANSADIKVSLAKVESAMTKEQVAQAQREALEFKPETAAAPGMPSVSAKTGSVSVRADDDQSEVFVDGEFVGNPPTRLKLLPGKHVIEVKRAGYKTYRRELQVSEGAELNLKAVAEKE